MKDNTYCHLWLTCKDEEEANKIGSLLLSKHLVACVKKSKVESDFLWNEKLDHNSEILIIMESRLDLFKTIEKEVAKLHTYDTFVLQAVPLLALSTRAKIWVDEVIN